MNIRLKFKKKSSVVDRVKKIFEENPDFIDMKIQVRDDSGDWAVYAGKMHSGEFYCSVQKATWQTFDQP